MGMARPSATAALLFLLLAVAHCRTLELEAQPAAGDGDENGPPNNLTLPAEKALPLPAEQQQHGFLRLPSHRPCRYGPSHRHHLSLWWARRLHHRHGEALGLAHLAALPLPTEEAPVEEEVNKAAVAEPDPDRSLPDTDDSEEADHHEHEVRAAWKKEMQRRSSWLQFHQHHRHGVRHHHHHDDEEEAAAEGVKRLHRHGEDEDKQHTMTKRFRHADHDDDSDSEDEEVEELVRRFRKAIMCRRRGFAGHGRRFHHHHRHAEKEDAQEGNGVVPWIKGLFNRF